MGTLFIVATPIGNLQDISLRALETLKSVDLLLCEDTRVTKKLLLHYGISVPTISYHQHSSPKVMRQVADLLSQGKNLALLSDAGTPGISDPGNELVEFLLQHNKDISLVPIPGASAVGAICSIAGVSMSQFLFLGYPPHKNKRKKFFESAANSPYPVVLYESPYRIIRTLKEILEKRDAQVVVARELTKKFETVYRGTASEVFDIIEKSTPKGEFVLVIVPLDKAGLEE